MELDTALDFARSRHQGVLTTLKRDGRPQLSNIAYAVAGDGTIRISVTDDRAKTNNLRRDPRASLHVARDDFYAYCVIEADVEIMPITTTPDDATSDALVEYYRAVAGEHDDWDDYRKAMIDEGRTILVLSPTHAYGMLPS
ncbi:MAG: PPOX class F420-dependent oxidoreductase [Ilumatobacter sp.]|nr:PPOX class F420-dependent oxidoreductase [Ilumatobacter sp.]